MKKPYTEVSMKIRIFQCLDVLTSSGDEPTDDILFEDIFN